MWSSARYRDRLLSSEGDVQLEVGVERAMVRRLEHTHGAPSVEIAWSRQAGIRANVGSQDQTASA